MSIVDYVKSEYYNPLYNGDIGLAFNCNHSRIDDLTGFAKAHPTLVSITISNADLSNADLEEFSKFEKLKQLELLRCNLSDKLSYVQYLGRF